ncbi:MAG: RHS repeat-associated core domain-containing protein [Bacteroidota bacterium]|nr:RHS repeat-associated core domain-containing protein [Bacteroidota bacterium]
MGNVLATISDKKIAKTNGTSNVDYFDPDIVTLTDYYAFGAPMPGRHGVEICSDFIDTTYVNNYLVQEDFSSSSVGGFVAGTGSITVTNPTGNVLHIESIWTSRPLATKTVAVAATTNYTLDFDIDTFSNISGFAESVRVRIFIPGGSPQTTIFTTTGSKSINFSSVNAGNVTIEISQVITGSGSYGSTPNPYVDIDNLNLYYVSMVIDTSTICSVNGKRYKYGFNGMEKDNETYGEGNAYDFGARIYDSRLGRWLSLDPLMAEYSSFTPYNSFINNPLFFIDNAGLNHVQSNLTPQNASTIYKFTFDKVEFEIEVRGNTILMNATKGKGANTEFYSCEFKLGVLNPFIPNSLQINPNATIKNRQNTGQKIIDNQIQFFKDQQGKILKDKKGEFRNTDVLQRFLESKENVDNIVLNIIGTGYELAKTYADPNDHSKGFTYDLLDEEGKEFMPNEKNQEVRKEAFLLKRAEILKVELFGTDKPLKNINVVAGTDATANEEAGGVKLEISKTEQTKK